MQYRRKPNVVDAIRLTADLVYPTEAGKDRVMAPAGCWMVVDPIKGQFFMTNDLFIYEYEEDKPTLSGFKPGVRGVVPVGPNGGVGGEGISVPFTISGQGPYVGPSVSRGLEPNQRLH